MKFRMVKLPNYKDEDFGLHDETPIYSRSP